MVIDKTEILMDRMMTTKMKMAKTTTKTKTVIVKMMMKMMKIRKVMNPMKTRMVNRMRSRAIMIIRIRKIKLKEKIRKILVRN